MNGFFLKPLFLFPIHSIFFPEAYLKLPDTKCQPYPVKSGINSYICSKSN